jgi:hypothetical protein
MAGFCTFTSEGRSPDNSKTGPSSCATSQQVFYSIAILAQLGRPVLSNLLRLVRLAACDETPYAKRIVDVPPQRILAFHNDIHKRTCLAGRLDHFCHQLLFIDLVAA